MGMHTYRKCVFGQRIGEEDSRRLEKLFARVQEEDEDLDEGDIEELINKTPLADEIRISFPASSETSLWRVETEDMNYLDGDVPPGSWLLGWGIGRIESDLQKDGRVTLDCLEFARDCAFIYWEAQV